TRRNRSDLLRPLPLLRPVPSCSPLGPRLLSPLGRVTDANEAHARCQRLLRRYANTDVRRLRSPANGGRRGASMSNGITGPYVRRPSDGTGATASRSVAPPPDPLSVCFT